MNIWTLVLAAVADGREAPTGCLLCMNWEAPLPPAKLLATSSLMPTLRWADSRKSAVRQLFQFARSARDRKRPILWRKTGWGGRDRTSVWRNQNPLPYRLATPQSLPL
jgi:hypothetical protein